MLRNQYQSMRRRAWVKMSFPKVNTCQLRVQWTLFLDIMISSSQMRRPRSNLNQSLKSVNQWRRRKESLPLLPPPPPSCRSTMLLLTPHLKIILLKITYHKYQIGMRSLNLSKRKNLLQHQVWSVLCQFIINCMMRVRMTVSRAWMINLVNIIRQRIYTCSQSVRIHQWSYSQKHLSQSNSMNQRLKHPK